MHRIFLLLASVFFPAHLAMADTVFKCTDENGRTVFSDRKCGQSAERVEFKHPESYYEKTMRESQESKARQDERSAEHAAKMAEIDKRINEARRKRDAICRARSAEQGLVIGMTKDAILSDRVWGYPDESSRTRTANGLTEYLVYKCEGHESVRLFITNGQLRSIHN